MFHPFKTILIPVDLSINTEVAVKKGLELATCDTTIHLLHIQNSPVQDLPVVAYRYLVGGKAGTSFSVVRAKMEQWKQAIEQTGEGVKVCTWVIRVDNSIQKNIEEKAKELKADLIIIGKNSHHSLLPLLNTVIPSKIVKQSGIPVLTVKPGSLHNRIKTVIVPITSDATTNKMEAIETICKRFRVKVYLVTFTSYKQPDEFYASVLLQMYQWLKTSVHCPVEYAVLRGKNKAKTLLNYAEKVNADILLVHPETETKIGWLNKHISDVLPAASKMQVLAVQPAA